MIAGSPEMGVDYSDLDFYEDYEPRRQTELSEAEEDIVLPQQRQKQEMEQQQIAYLGTVAEDKKIHRQLSRQLKYLSSGSLMGKMRSNGRSVEDRIAQFLEDEDYEY
ncbi:hypothetical protein SS50377_20488 [Spironucleus salmonicida]|uniref:Uncharacterized protein n=1 Tax=Spironucleus salmonicida TaxID=348837 RepID=A0A9P8M059_9EUKA|nr:hypothetical protein SS50377_20488 [Spironucleus salmonicida]